jgi:hypothetical protein
MPDALKSRRVFQYAVPNVLVSTSLNLNSCAEMLRHTATGSVLETLFQRATLPQ